MMNRRAIRSLIVVLFGLVVVVHTAGIQALPESSKPVFADPTTKSSPAAELLVFSSDEEVYGLDLLTGVVTALGVWRGGYEYQIPSNFLNNTRGGRTLFVPPEGPLPRSVFLQASQNPKKPSLYLATEYNETNNEAWIVLVNGTDEVWRISGNTFGIFFALKPIGWLSQDTVLLAEYAPSDGRHIAYYVFDIINQGLAPLATTNPENNGGQAIIDGANSLIVLQSSSELVELDLVTQQSTRLWDLPDLSFEYLWGWLAINDVDQFRMDLAAYQESLAPLTPTAAFLYWPIPSNHSVSCAIGCYPGHRGIDVGASTANNTPIYAAADGTVVAKDNSQPYGWNRVTSPANGNFVKIRHDNGYHTAYLHMTPDIQVNVGDRVQAGRLLGYGSNSGLTCGTQAAQSGCMGYSGSFYHLHFEVQGSCGGSSCWVNPYDEGLWIYSNGQIADPPSTPPPTCNPNPGANQVTLFTLTGHDGTNGPCVTKEIGEYPNAGSIGLPNDSIKSLRVGDNVKLTLCQDDNYGGNCNDFESDFSDIGNLGVGYGTSSAKVVERPGDCSPNADQVVVFDGTQYGGDCQVRGIGNYTNPGAIGMANDSISSIKVGPGVHVTLCADGDYGGNCRWFDSDDPDLSNEGFGGGGGVSSMRVVADQYNCSAGSWQVALFLDPGYGGLCITLDLGEYPNPAYVGLPNDRISSIKVGDNVQGVLCRGNDYSEPPCETFKADDSNLADNPTGDDSVSSVKVEARPPTELPDLIPFAPEGYEYEVVPSSYGGTHTLNVLYSGVPTYFDWHFTNAGPIAASGNFRVEVWVDDIKLTDQTFWNITPGAVKGGDDLKGVVPTPNWHKVKLVIDPDNAIAEADESNNVWEHDFHWNAVTGWYEEYFPNQTLSGHPTATYDCPIWDDVDGNLGFFTFFCDSPIPNINSSSRWTRTVSIDAGSYYFWMLYGCAGRLKINGKEVYANWPPNPSQAPCYPPQGSQSEEFHLPLEGGQTTFEFETYRGAAPTVGTDQTEVMIRLVPASPIIDPIINPDNDGAFTVSWSSVPGAVSYDLQEQFNNGLWENLAHPNNPLSVNITARADGQWCYRVKAIVDATGSSWSDIQCTSVTSRPDLVDLAPHGPNGYGIVPSMVRNIPFFFTEPPLYGGHATYFDGYVLNLGGSEGEGADFSFVVQIDGVISISGDLPIPPNSERSSSFFDWPVTLTPGEHTITFIVDPENLIKESNDKNNTWEGAFTWLPVNGWWGEYFANPDLSGDPVFVRDDEQINFNWDFGSPHSSVPPDNFSVRWTREVYFEAGVYEFTVARDDGARLKIGDVIVFDQWFPGQEELTFRYTNEQAGYKVVVFETFDAYGHAWAGLSWKLRPTPPIINTIVNPDSVGDFSVTWSSVENTYAYEVTERRDSGEWDYVQLSAATAYNASGKAEGQWCYQVRAATLDWQVSDWSNMQCTSVGQGGDTTPPTVQWLEPVATGQSYDVYGEMIRLKINAADNSGVAGTLFEWWNTSDEQWILIDQDFSSPYEIDFDTSVLNPGCNAVTASAYDPEYNIDSTGISLCLLPLTSPSVIIDPPDTNQGDYTIHWLKVTGATAYELHERKDNGGWTQVYSGPQLNVSRNAMANGEYCYRARSVRGSATSAWSGELCVRVDQTTSPLPTPEISAIENDEHRPDYLVQWASSVGADSYQLQEQYENGPWSIVQDGSGTNYIAYGRPIGTWCYRVRALGEKPASDWSVRVCTVVSIEFRLLLPAVLRMN